MIDDATLTESAWTMAAPYLKAGLAIAIGWLVGKAQEKGGPLAWIFKRSKADG